MYPDEPELAISRVLDASRELAFRAFTDPDVTTHDVRFVSAR